MINFSSFISIHITVLNFPEKKNMHKYNIIVYNKGDFIPIPEPLLELYVDSILAQLVDSFEPYNNTAN